MHGIIKDSVIATDKLARDIDGYVSVLQAIAEYKADTDDDRTPYQLEMRRKDMHDRLFSEDILPALSLRKGFTENDAYLRSKDIFSNLDKVWRIYDMTEFDITDDNCAKWLVTHLYHFLQTTETKYFLEGVTDKIHGIHIY